VTGAQRDGIYLLSLGAAVFFLFAFIKASVSPGPMMDFRLNYNGARCLLKECDPYNPSNELRLYRSEGATYPADGDASVIFVTNLVYPPSEFAITLPFALMPLGVAQALWVGAIAVCFLLASALMWVLGSRYAPVLSGALLGLMLALGFPQLFYGNPGCLVVGLVAVAAGCFLLERWEGAGVVCMAAALALKPHDSGLVWLFFLLAGGSLRRRAWQSLALATAVSLPVVLWTWHLSPHWPQELVANLHAFTIHGGFNDPAPASAIEHGTCAITSLQAVWSNVRDEPRFYNLASMALTAPLLLIGGVVTLRAKPDRTTTWLGLAAVASFTLLPVYHRIYDAKLLMLTIPACALLWAEGGRLRWVALALTTLGQLVTGELVWSMVLLGVKSLHLSATVLHGPMVGALFSIPVPLTLLALGCFYLWVYVRRCLASTRNGALKDNNEIVGLAAKTA
jgi:hypothetical protein